MLLLWLGMLLYAALFWREPLQVIKGAFLVSAMHARSLVESAETTVFFYHVHSVEKVMVFAALLVLVPLLLVAWLAGAKLHRRG